jgi:hypothetical protein
MKKRPALVVFGLMLGLLTACGTESEGEGETTTKSKPTATATAEALTAYSPALMNKVEREVKAQMRDIVRGNDATTESMDVDCVADNERRFTCLSSVEMRFDGGFCATIDSEQRGTVTEDGDYDWKSSVNESGSNEPEPCY